MEKCQIAHPRGCSPVSSLNLPHRPCACAHLETCRLVGDAKLVRCTGPCGGWIAVRDYSFLGFPDVLGLLDHHCSVRATV